MTTCKPNDRESEQAPSSSIPTVGTQSCLMSSTVKSQVSNQHLKISQTLTDKQTERQTEERALVKLPEQEISTSTSTHLTVR